MDDITVYTSIENHWMSSWKPSLDFTHMDILSLLLMNVHTFIYSVLCFQKGKAMDDVTQLPNQNIIQNITEGAIFEYLVYQQAKFLD